MNCPACGHSLAAGAAFCADCGAKIGAPGAAPSGVPPSIANAGAGGAALATATWNDMKSQFPGLLSRVTNILVRPRTEWPVIANESTSTLKLYTGYVAPLAAIGPLASIIGMSLVGISIPFVGTIRTPIASSLMHAIVSFVLALVGVFVLSLIVNALAPKFGGERNGSQALKVAAYAYTPGWLAGVLLLLPMLSLLAVIAALYGLYLMYLGLPILMKAAKEKAVAYTAVVVLCAIGLGVVVAAISGAMIGGQGMSLMGMRGNAVEREAASEKAGAAAAGALLGGVLGQDASGKAALGSAIGRWPSSGGKRRSRQCRRSHSRHPEAEAPPTRPLPRTKSPRPPARWVRLEAR